MKQQLIIHSRSRQRAPNLTTKDRTLLGFLSLFLNPRRLARSAIIIKPSTLLSFHKALKNRKYRLLYSPRGGRKPGPKGPPNEVIRAIVEMKQRNPRYGCPRIAQQINLAFGLDLDKDIVRRVLAVHYRPNPADRRPSWLTILGHAKDSLWSVDLFRAGSSASLSMPEMSMAQRSAGCLTRVLLDNAGQRESAPITTHCFNIIAGKRIYECSRLKRSNHCRMFRCRIRS